MSKYIIYCQCCLKRFNASESRIQTTNKTREIFSNFIKMSLNPGLICGKCNINLLTFDAFQKEITRKHNEMIRMKKEQAQQVAVEDPDELIEGIVFEEEDEEEESITLAQLAQTLAKPSSPMPEKPKETNSEPEKTKISSSEPEKSAVDSDKSSTMDDDENDVIHIPQEPQVPIDVDDMPDEPEKSEKLPEEILYKCDHCTAVSAKKDVIVQHIRKSHTFKCDQCNKIYPSLERLTAHQSRVHHQGLGNKRKQALVPNNTDEQVKFRLKSRPYGRPFPSPVVPRRRI